MADIGIRIYKLNLYDTHDAVGFGADGLGAEPEIHIRRILGQDRVYNDPARERTYRGELLDDGDDFFHGHIKYGIYGIASTINVGMIAEEDADDADEELDEVQEIEVIRRGVLDVEEIPMYFMAYFPADERNAYIAFQTYQTRSCATLVLGHLIQSFNTTREHLNQRLTVSKVMLSGEQDPAVRNRPVKEITLIRNRMPSDRFDRYVREGIEEIKLRMTIAAVRGRSLGQYIGIFNSYQAHPDDILVFDGLQFEKATALVDLGENKKRKVNLIGYDSTAGSIDITDLVDYDEANEYPTVESLEPIFRDSITDISERLADQED